MWKMSFPVNKWLLLLMHLLIAPNFDAEITCTCIMFAHGNWVIVLNLMNFTDPVMNFNQQFPFLLAHDQKSRISRGKKSISYPHFFLGSKFRFFPQDQEWKKRWNDSRFLNICYQQLGYLALTCRWVPSKIEFTHLQNRCRRVAQLTW